MIPKVVKMDVYPVAGHDSMELNLSGAHAPWFTRNVVVLEDSTGNLGVGEVPGGQKITKALEDVKHLVLGTRIVDYNATMNNVRKWLNENIKDDVRGLQTFDLRTGVHAAVRSSGSMQDGPDAGHAFDSVLHRRARGKLPFGRGDARSAEGRDADPRQPRQLHRLVPQAV